MLVQQRSGRIAQCLWKRGLIEHERGLVLAASSA